MCHKAAEASSAVARATDVAAASRRRDVTVPIIGMTASATAADEQACLDAGMDAFLAKPVGLDRLRHALESTTDGAIGLHHPADVRRPHRDDLGLTRWAGRPDLQTAPYISTIKQRILYIKLISIFKEGRRMKNFLLL